MFLSRVPLILAFLSLTAATTLRIQIPASNILPNPNSLPASTHATLTSGTSPQLHAPIRRGSILEFINITEPGSYLLDIYSRDYTFAPYRVDVASSPNSPDTPVVIEGIWETYRGTRWDDKGPTIYSPSSSNPAPSDPPSPADQSQSQTPQVITIFAKILTRKTFYDERQGFNPMSLLKNPMMLLGIVALAITFGMPKMMESMDPEMKEEFDAMQKKGPTAGLTRALQGQGPASQGVGGFDLAGWMAGAQTGGAGTTRTSGADASGDGAARERKGVR